MSKRLQVVIDDAEYGRFHRHAAAVGLTVSEWVRQTLRAAERDLSTAEPGHRLAVLRRGLDYADADSQAPAVDIEQMLAEIDSGYGALAE